MGRRALGRLVAVAVPLLLALLGAAVTAGWFWIRGSLQPLRGGASLPGLDSAVTVYVDGFDIPHVFASTTPDAFRAQGWIHAGERLWQMELLRRSGEGRLAELFGEEALAWDRLVRTLDLSGAAGRSVEALPRPHHRLLDAYAAGVNARLRDWSGPLPPEFLLLGIEPTPWEPRASAVIGKLMTLDLSHWKNEIARHRASATLDRERFRTLLLPYPEWGPTILGPAGLSPEEAEAGGGRGRGPAAPVDRLRAGEAGGAGARRAAAGARGPVPRPGASRRAGPTFPDPDHPVLGPLLPAVALRSSNAWAVAGVRSWIGQPILASDMHLPLRAPSTWYLNGLHAEVDGLHVAGLSLPGVPGVVVGYNREIAWAFSNGMVDDMDFALEEVDARGEAYRLDGRWEPFRVRRETIPVRGRDGPVVIEVRETVRGPLITDVLDGIEAPMSALWTGRAATTELVGLLGMGQATGPADFDRAVRRFAAPHQNVIYATARGVLGYRLSGSVPRRSGWTGWMPVPADTVGRGWDGFLPPDTLPALLNPSRGYIASANNLQGEGWFGVIGTDYPVPFRAARIVERLEAEVAWTEDLMRRLQLDVRSGFAERVLDRAIRAADRIGVDSVAVRLAEWDRRVSLDSPDATLFYIWLYRLRELIAADEYAGTDPDWRLFPDDALLALLEAGGGPWVDDVRTDTLETLGPLEERAMADALAAADGRRWGEVHHELHRHPLGRSEWLDRIFGFDIGPTPSPGGPHTVRPDDPLRWRPLDPSSWRPPFLNDYGPSERFVAELRPGRSHGQFLLPTGQSGNPFSPHYRDMAPRWAESNLIPVPIYRDEVRERAAGILQLGPP